MHANYWVLHDERLIGDALHKCNCSADASIHDRNGIPRYATVQLMIQAQSIKGDRDET